jgi:hypothetical protein
MTNLWSSLKELPPYPSTIPSLFVSAALKSACHLTKLDVSLSVTYVSVDFDGPVRQLGSQLRWLSVRQSRHKFASEFLQPLTNLT